MRAIAFGSILFLPLLASAEETTIPLTVEKGLGAEGCPDASALVETINATMKREVLAKGAAGSQIVVEFSRDPKQYKAAIRVVSGERAGVRTLDDPGKKCDDLAQAVVVTLVVMLDEGLGPQPAPSMSASTAPSSSAPQATPSISVSSVPIVPARIVDVAVPPKRTTHVSIGVGTGVSSGIVRSLAPYFDTGVDVVTPSARFGLGAYAIFPQHYDVGSVPSAASLSLVAAQAMGCATWAPFTRASWGLCGVVALGGMRGRTEGLPVDDARTRTWLAAGAMARADGPLLDGLSWSLRATALVPQTRHGFDVAGAGMVYEPAFVGISLGFAVAGTIL